MFSREIPEWSLHDIASRNSVPMRQSERFAASTLQDWLAPDRYGNTVFHKLSGDIRDPGGVDGSCIPVNREIEGKLRALLAEITPEQLRICDEAGTSILNKLIRSNMSGLIPETTLCAMDKRDWLNRWFASDDMEPSAIVLSCFAHPALPEDVYLKFGVSDYLAQDSKLAGCNLLLFICSGKKLDALPAIIKDKIGWACWFTEMRKPIPARPIFYALQHKQIEHIPAHVWKNAPLEALNAKYAYNVSFAEAMVAAGYAEILFNPVNWYHRPKELRKLWKSISTKPQSVCALYENALAKVMMRHKKPMRRIFGLD